MELETRHCTNPGCKRHFRVTTASKQTTCSNACTHGPQGPPLKGKSTSGQTPVPKTVSSTHSQEKAAEVHDDPPYDDLGQEDQGPLSLPHDDEEVDSLI